MERVYGTSKASKYETTDYISNMPENVITDILDRLTIDKAVRTSILSRRWRFCWTTVTQLIFDFQFIRFYLPRKDEEHGVRLFYRKNLGQIFLQHKGSLTKFELYIPASYEIDIQEEEYDEMHADIADDINYWIRFLSTKGLKEFYLRNMSDKPLKLSNNIFSCLQLKHLHLRNCCLHPVLGLHCFQNLSTFDFTRVTIEGYRFGEFLTSCPLLESLDAHSYDYCDSMELVEIGKLGNLKKLYLCLDALDDIEIKSSDLSRCMGFLTKLEELELNFEYRTFLSEVGARKTSSTTWPCLKTLKLIGIKDLGDDALWSCVLDLLNGSPNLQTLYMGFIQEEEDVSPTPPDSDSLEVDFDIRGNSQLRSVTLKDIRGSEIEICLIKCLLASSPLLKKMNIMAYCEDNPSWRRLSQKLLKLHPVSPFAEIDLSYEVKG